MKVVIVGAGIGGLAAALAFRRRGWEATVLERAPQLTEVGAGVQVSPNGFKVLEALGLSDAALAAGDEPEVLEMRLGASGRRLFQLPQRRVMRARFGAPYIQIHRADLLETLHQGAVDAGVEIRSDVAVEAYRGGAALSGGAVEAEGDLLIGADGLRSAIRAAMLGAEAPRFTGVVAWRAVAPMAGLDLPDGACAWVGTGRHAVTYPLRGGTMANFVGLVERDEPDGESWTVTGRREDALADFGDWAPPLRQILERAEVAHRWPLFDRPELPRWSDGRAVLLGDACHPMLPSFAQGACQALEDAWRLACEVSDSPDDIPAALTAYESRRKPRVTAIQAGARANMWRFHRRDALTSLFGFAPIWLAGRVAPGVIARHTAWVYAHDEVKDA